MLEIINYNEDEYQFPCLIVLGCFDGLHIGHAELLKKAKLQAKINGLDLGVMMFAGGKSGKQMFSFEERVNFLEKLNVKFVLKVDFNDEFKKTKPLDFLQNLEEKLNVKAYMSGKDFRFGEGAKGKSSTLKGYAEDEENGVWYMSVKDVTYEGQKVSTTMIKKLLANGEVKLANELLGRNFTVTGTVVSGADRGGKVVGVPTINLAYPEDKAELKHGVYTVNCTVGENVYGGIANFGERPTFGDKGEVLEVHLDGYEGSCYGSVVTVEFLDYIRDIQKFDSAEALREQLIKDKARIGETPDGQSAFTNSESETTAGTFESVSHSHIASVIESAVEELAISEQHTHEQPVEHPEEAEQPVDNEHFAEQSADESFEQELAEEFSRTEEVQQDNEEKTEPVEEQEVQPETETEQVNENEPQTEEIEENAENVVNGEDVID